jgi:transcription elongation GreA/GreB family factor
MLELKNKIKKNLLVKLENELHEIESAAVSARAYALQDDLKSEGKYDTRAIEASYLASAQQRRVEEIKLDLQMIQEMEIQKSSHLEMGALALIDFNKREQFYFLSPTLGGELMNVDGHSVLIISVFSPIGSEAMNLSKGDSFEVETPKETRSYLIKEVF